MDTRVCTCVGQLLVAGVSNREGSNGDAKWGCLFGTSEVSAEMIAPGVLRCTAPPHPPGVVSFSVTANDGEPCSLIQRLEYKSVQGDIIPTVPDKEGVREEDINLQIRLGRILTRAQLQAGGDGGDGWEESYASKWAWLEEMYANGEGLRADSVRDQLLVTLMKTHMEGWVRAQGAAHKIAELDEGGLSALHLCGALGYAWAVPLLAASGCDVDCPDAKQRTALHWAAACGR